MSALIFTANPDIVLMDMHDLKYPDDHYDLVYSRHSFEHAYDKKRAASEFVRVLRDGGVVTIEVPGNYKGGADYNVFTSTAELMEPFHHLWTPRKIPVPRLDRLESERFDA